MAKISANSIDLIFTDPPYVQDSIGLYGDLAREAQRVLKQGGYCFAYCGAQFLPQTIDLMKPYLDWFWLFEIKHKNGYPRFWAKKLMVGCKPVLVWTKGKPERTAWLCNLHVTEKGGDKRYHVWGQSSDFARKIIETLTIEGETVLDPFVGGGTTAKVCKELNREFIGFEIDQKLKAIIDSRMAQECLHPFLASYGGKNFEAPKE